MIDDRTPKKIKEMILSYKDKHPFKIKVSPQGFQYRRQAKLLEDMVNNDPELLARMEKEYMLVYYEMLLFGHPMEDDND